MLQPQLVDFVNLFPLDVAPHSEVFEAPLQGQHDGLGQAGIHHIVVVEADLLHMYFAGQVDLTRFDHQHVGAFRHLLRRQVQGTRHVGDDAARLHFHDIQNFLAGAGGGGDDHIHLANALVAVGIGGEHQPGAG